MKNNKCIFFLGIYEEIISSSTLTVKFHPFTHNCQNHADSTYKHLILKLYINK